jgi:hypothetical protein
MWARAEIAERSLALKLSNKTQLSKRRRAPVSGSFFDTPDMSFLTVAKYKHRELSSPRRLGEFTPRCNVVRQ